MGIYRCYSGDNGESHLEQLDFDSNTALQELQKSEGLNFRRPGVGGPAPGIVNDPDGFHCAPNPRWTVILQGSAVVGLGDGSQHNFGVGDMILFEDLTGHGHQSTWNDVIIAVNVLDR